MLERCRHLEALSLRENRLTALPASLGLLSKLRELDVSRNQLREVPDFVRELPSLQVGVSAALLDATVLGLTALGVQVLNLADNPLSSQDVQLAPHVHVVR